jgi:hypothetical protein
MATPIIGVSASIIQAVQVTSMQPKIAQADPQTAETTALNSTALASGIQSAPDQPASSTSRATKTQQNQQNQQKADTVDISGAAKARMLKDKGNPISEIAVLMDVDNKAVEAYLGATTVTTQTTQTALQNSQSASQLPSSPAELASGINSEEPKGKFQAQSG